MKLQFDDSYCIDTSALIDMKYLYPSSVFGKLWKNMEQLVKDERIIAPEEVMEEIKDKGNKEDEILKWAKKNRRMFIRLDMEQVELARTIVSTFRQSAKPDKQTAEADPFVISLAKSRGCIVVTQEKRGGEGSSKIPNICEKYSIKCIRLLDLFVEQKWEF